MREEQRRRGAVGRGRVDGQEGRVREAYGAAVGGDVEEEGARICDFGAGGAPSASTRRRAVRAERGRRRPPRGVVGGEGVLTGYVDCRLHLGGDAGADVHFTFAADRRQRGAGRRPGDVPSPYQMRCESTTRPPRSRTHTPRRNGSARAGRAAHSSAARESSAGGFIGAVATSWGSVWWPARGGQARSGGGTPGWSFFILPAAAVASSSARFADF